MIATLAALALAVSAAAAPAPGPLAPLSPFIGRWETTTRLWSAPGAAPVVAKGVHSFSWALGGKFLKEDASGKTADGKPFQAVGYVGWDESKSEFAIVWLDTTIPGITSSRGRYDAAAGVLKDEGTLKGAWFRSEWTMPKDGRSVYSAYAKDAAGKEYKAEELVYLRAE